MVRIGISGWRYKGWRGVFYPAGLAQRRELEFASRQFRTIELNGTFYSLRRPDYFANWAQDTPDGFVFAVKGSRYITHMLKLRGVERAMGRFFGQGLLRLGAKLGPILWQFLPNLHFERDRFEAFFRLPPRTMGEAQHMVHKHNDLPQTRSWTSFAEDGPLRHCVEIRHESFVVPEYIDLLREYGVGNVVADTVKWPLLMDVTSDFVYCRLHGSEQLYASGYGSKRWKSGQNGCAPGRVGVSLRTDGLRGAKSRPRSQSEMFTFISTMTRKFEHHSTR